MTGTDISKKIESFSNLISEFGVSNFNSRDIWNRKKEIDENFKAAQFNTAEEKENIVNSFNTLVELLSKKEKEVEEANKTFTTESEALVTNFEAITKEILGKESVQKEDFKILKTESNKIFELFKQQRWATKESRTNAWDIYNNTRNLIRDCEDQVISKERDDRNKLTAQSLEITEKLCVVANACHPSIDIEVLQQTVTKFSAFIDSIGFDKNLNKWFVVEKPNEIKLSLKSRSETLNDIRTFLGNHRDQILREHKAQIFNNIDALKDDLNKAWDLHKIEQQRKQEQWEIKQKERDEKRLEWAKKQQDFLLMLEKRLENQISYKAKQEGYLNSQKEYATRFESRIVAQQEYIKKLIDQINDLEKKHATAWTEDFKTKVEEWIEEKKEKMATVEADIIVLKEKVTDIKKNVESLPQRISELTTSIAEIQDKIQEVKTKLENDKLNPTENPGIEKNTISESQISANEASLTKNTTED